MIIQRVAWKKVKIVESLNRGEKKGRGMKNEKYLHVIWRRHCERVEFQLLSSIDEIRTKYSWRRNSLAQGFHNRY